MKSKKILTILLSLAIMFTFMPAMAFAQTVKSTNIPQGELTVNEAVEWSSDYHTATAYLVNSDGTQSYVANFEYFDNTSNDPEKWTVGGKAATKDDLLGGKNGPRFVIYQSGSNSNGSVDYDLGVIAAEQIGTDKYVWDYSVLDDIDEWGFDWNPKTPAIAETMYAYDVFDASRFKYKNGYAQDVEYTVDAGDYSYWFAHKDEYANNQPVATFPTALAGLQAINGWNTDELKALYTVTFPEYSAYDYDKENSANSELTATVALNEAAIKSVYGSTVKVSTATAALKIVPAVSNIDDVYGEWVVDGTIGKHGAKKAEADINYAYATYDGTSHGITFVNAPKEVSYKYFLSKEDAKGNYEKPKTKADYVDTFAGIKDAGTYHVWVKQILNKTKAEYITNDAVVVIHPYTVNLGFTQTKYIAEYGKYTVDDILGAVKGFIVYDEKNLPDSKDAIKAAVEKYATVKGVFEQAGEGYLTAVMGEYAADDTTTPAALANYTFESGDTMRLVVEKADNNITIKTSAKSFKAKKKTKKLAKTKSFKISYEVQKGTVNFTKVSGNSKIKVSKAGKVTVKKGLKKGTYKLKVKAIAAGNANFAQATATKTIKIKIK